MNTNIDLNRIGMLKLVAGKTVGEQLKGVKLAGPEVVEFIRSFDRPDANFIAPAHWEKPTEEEYTKGTTIVRCYCLSAKEKTLHFDYEEFLGFAWFTKGMPPERKPLVEKTGLKIPEEDVMNLMVFGSDEMAKGGWRTWERILIEL